MLTAMQHKLLTILAERQDSGQPGYSYEQLVGLMGMKGKSKSGIARLVDGLEERGFIRRLPYRSRAIEVIKRYEWQHPKPTPGMVTAAASALRRQGFGIIPAEAIELIYVEMETARRRGAE